MLKRFIAAMGVVVLLMQFAVPAFAAEPAYAPGAYADEALPGGVVDPAASDKEGYLPRPDNFTVVPNEDDGGLRVVLDYPAYALKDVEDFTIRFYPVGEGADSAVAIAQDNYSWPGNGVFDFGWGDSIGGGSFSFAAHPGWKYYVTIQANATAAANASATDIDASATDLTSYESMRFGPVAPASDEKVSLDLMVENLFIAPEAKVTLDKVFTENYSASPVTATWTDFDWAVGDTSIVTLNKATGELTGVKLGSTTLTPSDASGTYEALTIYVANKFDGTPTITNVPATLEPGKGVQLGYAATGTDLFGVEWSFDDGSYETDAFVINRGTGYLFAKSDAPAAETVKVQLDYQYFNGTTLASDSVLSGDITLALGKPTGITLGGAKNFIWRQTKGADGKYSFDAATKQSILATLLPGFATPTDVVEWKSSSKSVMDVAADPANSLKGNLTIKKTGSSTITVSTKDANGKTIKATAKVTVLRGVDEDGLVLTVPAAVAKDGLASGKTATFGVKFIDPADPAGKKTYTPSNKAVRYYAGGSSAMYFADSSKGKATATYNVDVTQAEGEEVTVTATSVDGYVTASAKIKVYKPYASAASAVKTLYVPVASVTDVVIPVVTSPNPWEVTEGYRDFEPTNYTDKVKQTLTLATITDIDAGSGNEYTKWVISGVKAGNVTLKFKNAKSDKTFSVAVKVLEGTLPTGITGDTSKSIDLKAGNTKNLTSMIKFDPADTKFTTLQWVVGDSYVASVSNTGLVKALNYGQTTVKAMALNPATGTFGGPGYEVEFTVNVDKKMTGAAFYASISGKYKKVTKDTLSWDGLVEPSSRTFNIVTTPAGAYVASSTDLTGGTTSPLIEILPGHDEAIATASANMYGQVTVNAGEKPGSTKIKVRVGTKTAGYANAAGAQKDITLTITNKRYVTSYMDVVNYNSLDGSTIAVKKTLKLTMTQQPGYVKPSKVEWTSSDPSIAKVNRTSGVVTGVAEGDAFITAKLPYGPTVGYNINIISANEAKALAAKAVKLRQTSFTLSKNATTTDIVLDAYVTGQSALSLAADYSPDADYADKYLKWTSSDPAKIAVTSGGTGAQATLRVQDGATKGKVTITARDSLSNKSAKLTITLVDAETKYATNMKLKAPKNYKPMNVGSTYKFGATFSGGTQNNKNMVWELVWETPATANGVVNDYAVVAPDGTVTALKSTVEAGSKIVLIGKEAMPDPAKTPPREAIKSDAFEIKQLITSLSLNSGRNVTLDRLATTTDTTKVKVRYQVSPSGPADAPDGSENSKDREVIWKTGNGSVVKLLDPKTGNAVTSIKTTDLSGEITLVKGTSKSTTKTTITGTATVGKVKTTITVYNADMTKVPDTLTIKSPVAADRSGTVNLAAAKSYTFKAELTQTTGVGEAAKTTTVKPADVIWTARYLNGMPVSAANLTLNATKGTVKWNSYMNSDPIRLTATSALFPELSASVKLTFAQPITKVTMLQSTVKAYAGGPSVQLYASVTPVMNEPENLVWTVSANDEKYAHVNVARKTDEGLYTVTVTPLKDAAAKANGRNVKVTATDPISGKKATATVKIYKDKPESQAAYISLNQKDLALGTGKSQKLTATVYDQKGAVMKKEAVTWVAQEGYFDGYEWTWYPTEIITVSTAGSVKGVNPTYNDPYDEYAYRVVAFPSNTPGAYEDGMIAACNVVVGDKLTKLSISSSSGGYALVGAVSSLNFLAQPDTGFVSFSQPEVTISNQSIASYVDWDNYASDGNQSGSVWLNFQGEAAGTTKVTVKLDGKTCTFNLTVQP